MRKPYENDKPLYVTIELVTAKTLDPTLTKHVPVEYTKQRFRDLFDFMIDPEKDNLNPGYTIEEKATAETLNDWIRKYQRNSEDKLIITYKVDGKPVEDADLTLDDMVGDFTDRIIQVDKVERDDGIVVPVKKIHLYTRYEDGGAGY